MRFDDVKRFCITITNDNQHLIGLLRLRTQRLKTPAELGVSSIGRNRNGRPHAR